jgi:murein L,D-transpeptidase YafK
MFRLPFLALLLLITACAPATTRTIHIAPPSSPRLENIRVTQNMSLADELRQQRFALGDPVFIRVFKREARLEVWMRDDQTMRFEPFKSYPICKFSGVLGPKLREGDLQSPEGFYMVGADQLNPNSNFHLSFDLGFPNQYDRQRLRTGSLLMIHGGCRSEGCYAMTDEFIEEIYLLVEASIMNGHDVPVHLFPFRMTPVNMALHRHLGWGPFWDNLKQGYDAFERTSIPPRVSSTYQRYVFN